MAHLATIFLLSDLIEVESCISQYKIFGLYQNHLESKLSYRLLESGLWFQFSRYGRAGEFVFSSKETVHKYLKWLLKFFSLFKIHTYLDPAFSSLTSMKTAYHKTDWKKKEIWESSCLLLSQILDLQSEGNTSLNFFFVLDRYYS